MNGNSFGMRLTQKSIIGVGGETELNKQLLYNYIKIRTIRREEFTDESKKCGITMLNLQDVLKSEEIKYKATSP